MTQTVTAPPSGESSGSRPSAVVLDALMESDAVDFDENDLRLYDVVNPEALNSLFDHRRTTGASVAFDVCDATVTVWQADGEILADVSASGE